MKMSNPTPLYRKMEFGSPIVNRSPDGIFSTVRRGIKWSDLKIGEKIMILDRIARLGTVVNVQIKRFNDLTDSDLEYNFQEGCNCGWGKHPFTAYKNLLKAMENVYEGFNNGEIITLVTIKDSIKSNSEMEVCLKNVMQYE